MNVIKLNNTEFTVTSYNRTTNFYDGGITSNGYASIEADNMAALKALAETPITSIEIFHDNTKIYDTGTINAHIDNINESMGEDQMYVNINMTFIMD